MASSPDWKEAWLWTECRWYHHKVTLSENGTQMRSLCACYENIHWSALSASTVNSPTVLGHLSKTSYRIFSPFQAKVCSKIGYKGNFCKISSMIKLELGFQVKLQNNRITASILLGHFYILHFPTIILDFEISSLLVFFNLEILSSSFLPF